MGTAMIVYEGTKESSIPLNPDGSVEFVRVDKWEAARYRRAIDVAAHKDNQMQRNRARVLTRKVAEAVSGTAHRDTTSEHRYNENGDDLWPDLVIDSCCAVETYVPTYNLDGTTNHNKSFYRLYDEEEESESILKGMREIDGELNFHDDNE